MPQSTGWSCRSHPKCLQRLRVSSGVGDPSVLQWWGSHERARFHTRGCCGRAPYTGAFVRGWLTPPSFLLPPVNARISPSMTPLLFRPDTASSQVPQQTQHIALLPGVTQPRARGTWKHPPDSRSKPSSSHHHLSDCSPPALECLVCSSATTEVPWSLEMQGRSVAIQLNVILALP